MLRVRLEVRLALGDTSDDLVLRPCLPPARAVLLHAGDAAPVMEQLRDGDAAGAGNLREELVERVGEFQPSFFDQLKDHDSDVRLGDRRDPVFRIRGQRLPLRVANLAVAEGAAVDRLPVPGDGQTAHPLVLLKEAVEQQVESGGVQRLGGGGGSAHQRQQDGDESGVRASQLYNE